MQQIITAKLKLLPTPEQRAALRQTQLDYRDALHAVSLYAFSQGKTSSVTKLHKGMYAQLRTRYRLPSQLACSVERQVAATRHRALGQTQEACRASPEQAYEKTLQGPGSPPALQFSNGAVHL
jgi:putative transposase